MPEDWSGCVYTRVCMCGGGSHVLHHNMTWNIPAHEHLIKAGYI